MSSYGYEIVQTLIIDIKRDVKFKKAINAGNILIVISSSKKKTLCYIFMLHFFLYHLKLPYPNSDGPVWIVGRTLMLESNL